MIILYLNDTCIHLNIIENLLYIYISIYVIIIMLKENESSKKEEEKTFKSMDEKPAS